MMHFLGMGGYGGFVWSAYAISGVALATAVLFSVRGYCRASAQLRRLREKAEDSTI
jgi:heme exporter protein CcmD